MVKIGVGGGAGFIGSHLVDKLIKKGYKVFVIDDLSGGFKENVNPKAKLYIEDCRNDGRMEEIFKKERPDIFFCLQANAAENKAQFSPVDITSRNYDAFIKVLTAAIRNGMKKFIFTSSIAVYGSLQTPFKEIDKPEPEDLYGITKLAAEQTLEVMSKVHDFKYVIARPHNCYGPRQNMRDPYRNVVTIFMNAILKGKSYYIYGDGEQVRCFSYVDPVVEALYKCGFEKKAEGKVFNIGSDMAYTVNDLSRAVQKVTGTSFAPIHLPDRSQEVKIAVSDHKLAKEILKYDDSVPLQTGLLNTWKWAKKKGYQEPVYSGFEIKSKKIPKNWRA